VYNFGGKFSMKSPLRRPRKSLGLNNEMFGKFLVRFRIVQDLALTLSILILEVLLLLGLVEVPTLQFKLQHF
jgi:hypothetical protein